MASPANAAILDGMPHPADLRVHHHEGTTFVTAGQMVIACYPGGEIAMRNVAVAVARQLGFSGQQVAQVMGLTDSYVATLHQRALREGAAGLVRPSGPKPKLSPQAWARAAKWRAARAGDTLAAAGGDSGPGGTRFADVALLSATSIGFALGAATTGQFKHLTAAAAGPVAGMAALPGLRTLRPRLAAIAGGCDPLELQAMFAQAMLEADPVASGVYYVDDHFIPYTGAKPVGKGWNNKRGRAEKGHADTHVTAHDGRAVCFVTGEPPGLTSTLPKALAELKKAAPPGAAIMLGFAGGGAYRRVSGHCGDEGVHWVTYRRAPLAVPGVLPVLATITINGRTREVAWAEETVQLKDYGDARQLTLFEHGQVALQVLTSDTDACPSEILAWLKSRGREETFFKYAWANYGIAAICDYAAVIETNTKVIDNPARKAANAAVRQAQNALAAARAGMAAMLADPAIPAAIKNTRLIPAARQKITRAAKALAKAEAARASSPPQLPATVISPHPL